MRPNISIIVGVLIMAAFNEYQHYKNNKEIDATMKKHEKEAEDLFRKFKSSIR